MTTLHEQAWDEAEKQFPERFVKDAPLGNYYDRNAGYRGVYAAGFLAGHEAATRTRVVTTVTELDALPVGSVVLDIRRHFPEAWQKYSTGWWVAGEDRSLASADVLLPARVLYEAEETR